jgi:hypothetical protein
MPEGQFKFSVSVTLQWLLDMLFPSLWESFINIQGSLGYKKELRDVRWKETSFLNDL